MRAAAAAADGHQPHHRRRARRHCRRCAHRHRPGGADLAGARGAFGLRRWTVTAQAPLDTLFDDPELVEAVGGAAAIAVENTHNFGSGAVQSTAAVGAVQALGEVTVLCAGASAREAARSHYQVLTRKRQDIKVSDPGARDMFDDRVYKRGALAVHAIHRLLADAPLSYCSLPLARPIPLPHPYS